MRSVRFRGINRRRRDVPLIEPLRPTEFGRESFPGGFHGDPPPIVRRVGQALDIGQLDFGFWEGRELWKDVRGGKQRG